MNDTCAMPGKLIVTFLSHSVETGKLLRGRVVLFVIFALYILPNL
jgi:hypothetical protein